MTSYIPTPGGTSAADVIVWWRHRARVDRVAVAYYSACRSALGELGTEAELRQISALGLRTDLVAEAAAHGCWAGLSQPSRHLQTLRLRRALRLFGAAVYEHAADPVAAPALPALLQNAGSYEDEGSTPALVSYLAADEIVAPLLLALLDAADLVATDATTVHLAALSSAVAALEAAVTEAGIAPERVPATTAALTAHVYRLGRRAGDS